MDENTTGPGAVIGTVTMVSRSRAVATVEDCAGHEVLLQGLEPAALEALAGRFDRQVLVVGAATWAKSGRIVSMRGSLRVESFEAAAPVVDMP